MNKERELLERAAVLIGNPGTNISGSTDFACQEWHRDYAKYIDDGWNEKHCSKCQYNNNPIWESPCGDCYTYSKYIPKTYEP